MFSRVNTDLGARIRAAAESLVATNEAAALGGGVAALKVAARAATNGFTNGDSHNSGMFAHKQGHEEL